MEQGFSVISWLTRIGIILVVIDIVAGVLKPFPTDMLEMKQKNELAKKIMSFPKEAKVFSVAWVLQVVVNIFATPGKPFTRFGNFVVLIILVLDIVGFVFYVTNKVKLYKINKYLEGYKGVFREEQLQYALQQANMAEEDFWKYIYGNVRK